MDLEPIDPAEKFLQSLPQKPVKVYDLKYKDIDIVSNHFFVKFDTLQKIYIYYVEFSPKVESDFRKTKQILIENIREPLTKEIGTFFLNGSSLFASVKPSFSHCVNFKTSLEGKNYDLKVNLSKSFTIKEIFSEDRLISSIPQKFFSILIKYFLKKLKFFEFGRTSKFYDPSKSFEIEQTKLLIYHGFQTSFNNYDGGFFLRIDISHKIVRTETVLHIIDRVYNEEKNTNLSKDEKRKLVKELLKGKVVLAMYGNYRYWRIDDVLFDKDCNTFMLENDNQQENKEIKNTKTLFEYYKEKYNMEIKKPRQPLLMHHQIKIKKTFYILPEFCVMTGIPDDFNDFLKKKVTDLCIKSPNERMMEIEGLTRNFNQDSKDPHNLKKLCDNLGITIEERPVEFKGKLLKEPIIVFGKDEVISDRTSYFQLNKQPFKDAGSFKWAILHFDGCKINELVQTFMHQAKNLEIKMSNPDVFNLHEVNGKKSINEIEYLLKNKIKGRFLIILIILPSQIKSAYKKIKQICYLDIGVLSQIVLSSTLERSKSYKSISSKLVQQIIVKVGSKLWVPELVLSKKLPNNLMLVGADLSFDRMNKNRAVVAFCASLDSTFTKYYNRVVFQKRDEEIINKSRGLFKDAITEFFKENKKVPETIIYFRDGVTDMIEKSVREQEISEILKAFSDFSEEYKPKLAVIRVEKRIAQKFFHMNEEGYNNPPSGTLIDSTIVSKNYDFYLIAQNVQRGTATPTHYKVIYDSSDLPAGMIQELVYMLCFSYMNWSGAIRVPAPCQYAHKLSVFVSQHLNEDPKEDLRNTLYYL